jgi:cell volume regulation protein A
MTGEPATTAIVLTAFAALLAIAVLFSRGAERLGIPVVLIFLLIGMLAGTDGLLGIPFDDYGVAFRVGIAALALILFDGGLNTPQAAIRSTLAPAGLLATAGVAGTALIVALAARLFGLDWGPALLLGAVVSSTDAAAVFSVLRNSGLHLKRRVGATLEVESGANDPMAVMLTIAVTQAVVTPGSAEPLRIAVSIVVQLAVGLAAGFLIGHAGRALLARYRLPSGGLYPALTVAIAFLAFGLPTLMMGSGFLAVYVTAVILGNGPLPHRSGLLRVHDALAWLSQVTMFLMLGLLAFPGRVIEVMGTGIILGGVLQLVARPLMVAICLLPFRYTAAEIAYTSWVGLRGAVPIVLAAYPVLAGAPGAERVFDIVFFIVVANAIVPGMTVPWLTRRLGLAEDEPPRPQAVLEIESRQPLGGDLVSFYVDPALAVAGARLADLPFPEGTSVVLIARGAELVPPRGKTTLLPGDHVYIFARPEDRPTLALMFGQPELQ